jgi:hypothetical protein
MFFFAAVSCGQANRKVRLPETETMGEEAVERPAAVYVVGYELTDSTYNTIPILWVDGNPRRLADNGHAYAVFVANDHTVYVAGDANDKAVLWKIQGQAIEKIALGNNDFTYGNAVFVTPQGDAFIAGKDMENDGAVCWKVSGTEITTLSLSRLHNSLVSKANSTFVLPGGDNLPESGANPIHATPGSDNLPESGANSTYATPGGDLPESGANPVHATPDGGDNLQGSGANSIYVTPDGDIHVAGYIGDHDMDDDWFATLWINGTGQILSNGKYAKACGVHVTDKGDVYVTGTAQSYKTSVIALWKNNEIQYLSEGVEDCTAYAVSAAPNGDVYVAGHMRNTEQYRDLAVVWKNGEKQFLTGGSDSSDAQSVYVTQEGDVYVAGNTGLNATLWKNGAPQALTNIHTGERSFALGVFVK